MIRAATTYVARHAQAFAGTAAIVMLLSWAVSIAGIFALHDPATDLILWPAIASFIVSGWVLAARLPRNSVGWLLLMTSAGLSFLPWSVLSAWMIRDDVALGRWTAGLSNGSFVFIVGGLALLLPLLFPDGRLPSRRRRWRVVLWCDLGYMLFALFNVFEPGPLDLPALEQKVQNPFVIGWMTPALSTLISIAAPLMMVGFAGSFTSLVVRWRSAGPVQRAQMKWVIVALVLAPVPFILHDWAKPVSDSLMTFVLPLVPIAVAISVLRFRLYDIDRVISRAVAYLIVTGLLVGLYVGCIALADVTLPLGSSSFAVAGSTLIVAALFQPVRRRIQAAVDQRFNRQRYDATRTIDAFAVRLRDEVDPDLVRHDLLHVASQAIQPASISLWVAS